MSTQVIYKSVAGYLLRPSEGGQYKIVNFKTAGKKMGRIQREKFRKETLIDIDEYLSRESDLFDCNSKLLFELVPTQIVSFWQQNDSSPIKVVGSLTKAAERSQKFDVKVIPIALAHNVKKYLRYCEDLPEYHFRTPKDLCYLIPERINTVAYKLFEIDKIRFTEADYRVLREYDLRRGYFVKLAQQVMKRCYEVASTSPRRSAMRWCFSSFVGRGSVMKKFLPDTIMQYGLRVAPYIFLLLRVNFLSIFSGYRRPRGLAGYTEIDTARLQLEFSRREIDVTYLSQVCVDMMNGKDTLGRVLETLIMCAALRFGTTPCRNTADRGDFEEDEDEDDEGDDSAAEGHDMKGIRNPKSPRNIRKTLDSLKAFLVFSCMCTAADQDLFDDECGTPMWKWIKTMYHKTLKEEENLDRYRISLVPSSDGVLICGKLFDRQYIRNFYFDCKSTFEQHLDRLNEFFFMPGVDQVARAILRNREVLFGEPKRGAGKSWGGESLLDMIPAQYRDVLLPQLRRSKHKRLTAAINKKVAHAVDEIACVLMWMVYFGAGFSYRFPELQLLAFSGPQRNVYVDEVSRRLQLFCDYNKSGSSAPTLKTLDAVTSQYLFFFIVVLRQMQINALGDDYREFSVVKWMDIQNVTLREDVTPEAVSRTALYSYIFLNSTRGDFIKYSSFRRYLEKFPKDDNQKLTFRELRQAMTAVTRHYVGGSSPIELMESMVNELMANHSVKTSLTMYGVDDFSLSQVSGTTATMLQERASERWISWLQLESLVKWESGSSETENCEADRTAVESEQSRSGAHCWQVRERPKEPRDSDDLFAAGRNLFGPRFKFRDSEQQMLCMDIYMGQKSSLIVQAAPGYGKTELYQLPLAAMASKTSCKFVSFLFVPYTVLLAAGLARLQMSDCLKVDNVKRFMERGYDGMTDVYVGLYEDLNSSQFAERIGAWDAIVGSSLRTKDVRLGYLIIDDFHNLKTEDCHSGHSKDIQKLNFDAFEKALFFSATAPPEIAEAALQTIGFKGLEKPASTVEQVLETEESYLKGIASHPTKFVDLVRKIPLGHIHKEFRTAENPRLEAVKILRKLFDCDPNSKAIVMVNQVTVVEELAVEWADAFDIVWVHGNLRPAEKVARAQSFMSDNSKRVLVGTERVAEGISIPNLKVVIIMNMMPNVLEFIQAAGRLRKSGMCYLLKALGRCPEFRNPQLPPINSGCLSAQIREFYGLDVGAAEESHQGCCGVLHGLPLDTRWLLNRMEQTEVKMGLDLTGRQRRLSSDYVSGEFLSYREVESKRFKRDHLGSEGIIDTFHNSD